jgi:transposase-like protein
MKGAFKKFKDWLLKSVCPHCELVEICRENGYIYYKCKDCGKMYKAIDE